MQPLRHVWMFASPRGAPRRHRRLRRRLLGAMFLVGIVDVIGTALVLTFEKDAAGGAIHGLWDAFYFTSVQLLTVSSSLPNPVTTEGQALNIFLQMTGICFVAGIAGTFASFFLTEEEDEDGVR